MPDKWGEELCRQLTFFFYVVKYVVKHVSIRQQNRDAVRDCTPKKINFFLSLSVPLSLLVYTLPSRGQNYFFFPFRKKPWKKTHVKITSKQDEGNIEMSSPDVTTGTRLEPPWSEDYHTTVEDMETNDLLKSTLTDESHKQKGDTKTCLFWGFI